MSKYADIKLVADCAIERTMREGEAKYPDNQWETRSDTADAQHAIIHLVQYLGDRRIDDLEHALTRVAIILKRRR